MAKSPKSSVKSPAAKPSKATKPAAKPDTRFAVGQAWATVSGAAHVITESVGGVLTLRDTGTDEPVRITPEDLVKLGWQHKPALDAAAWGPLKDDAAIAAVKKGGRRISKSIVIVEVDPKAEAEEKAAKAAEAAKKEEELRRIRRPEEKAADKALPFTRTPTPRAARVDLPETAKLTFVKKDHDFKPGTRNAHRMEAMYAVGLSVAKLLTLRDEKGKKLEMVDLKWNLRRGDIKFDV